MILQGTKNNLKSVKEFFKVLKQTYGQNDYQGSTHKIEFFLTGLLPKLRSQVESLMPQRLNLRSSLG